MKANGIVEICLFVLCLTARQHRIDEKASLSHNISQYCSPYTKTFQNSAVPIQRLDTRHEYANCNNTATTENVDYHNKVNKL